MESILKKLNRPIMFNGEQMTPQRLIESVKEGQEVSIYIPAIAVKQDECLERQNGLHSPAEQQPEGLKVNRTYLIKVRQYMTKPSTPEFDFHKKWNNDTPMPFRVMSGKVLKETPGMVQMECKVVPLETNTCIRCGRKLSHPVSRLYGIGPECGGHAHINPFQTEEELHAHLDDLKKQLSEITWTGWIIKSAIEEYAEVL